MNGKIKLIIVLVLGLMIFSGIQCFADEGISDINDHWAREEIEEFCGYGIINGYSDGTFKPNNMVTRAEFITMIDNLFKFETEDENYFNDVVESDWYSQQVSKASAEGIIKGYNNEFRPNDSISRQEAAVVLTKAFKLSSESETSMEFADGNQISDWARSYMKALVESGYMKGRGENMLAPLENLTRAEALVLLSNIAGDIIQEPGTYTESHDGNLFIAVRDVVIENEVINGNLYIAQGVGDGDVTLNNITVKGELVVLGGGENSISINNTSIGKLIVVKMGGKIRIVTEGTTSIALAELRSGATLVENGGEGTGFEDIEIIIIEKGQELNLDGEFDEVVVNISSESNVPEDEDTPVAPDVFTESFVEINVSEGSSLDEVNILGADSVTLSGEIGKVEVNGEVGDIEVESGAVEEIVFSDGAVVDSISISEDAKVDDMVVSETAEVETVSVEGTVEEMQIDSPVSIEGTGTVESAIVNSEDVSFEEEPDDVSGDAENIEVDGSEVDVEEVDDEEVDDEEDTHDYNPYITLSFVLKNGDRIDDPIAITARKKSSGSEIAEKILNGVYLNFDSFYDAYLSDQDLGEGSFLISALTVFNHVEAADLQGTIYESIPLDADDNGDYSDEEKKETLRMAVYVTKENILTLNTVKTDLNSAIENVDFSTFTFGGKLFKSVVVTDIEDVEIARYEQGNEKSTFVNAFIDQISSLSMTNTNIKFKTVITLSDNSEKTSLFGTDESIN